MDSKIQREIEDQRRMSLPREIVKESNPKIKLRGINEHFRDARSNELTNKSD